VQDVPFARYRVSLICCRCVVCTMLMDAHSLSKGENRLSFVTCNSCGSRRSVQAIKTGFSAQIGKRRRMIKT
jgi:translation initiation factor 2 subunit 2